jgi:hypothetical protein
MDHMEMPDAKMLSIRLARVEPKPAPQSIRSGSSNGIFPIFAYWDFATARMIITMRTASGVNDLMTMMRNCDSVIF